MNKKQIKNKEAQPKTKSCRHVGIVQISHNYDSVILACSKCGTIISKTGF